MPEHRKTPSFKEWTDYISRDRTEELNEEQKILDECEAQNALERLPALEYLLGRAEKQIVALKGFNDTLSKNHLRVVEELAYRYKAEIRSLRLIDTSRATLSDRRVESDAQRSKRRHAKLDPWLQATGITSPERWAEKAGGDMDKNTPRDYLNGKTKRLRWNSRSPCRTYWKASRGSSGLNSPLQSLTRNSHHFSLLSLTFPCKNVRAWRN